MLKEKEVQEIIQQLSNGEVVYISYHEFIFTIRFVDELSKLLITTLVYDGHNYIPISVRQSLLHKLPLNVVSIPTFLNIDENQFQINLNYLGQSQLLNYLTFKNLIEDFGFLANEWHMYLDERGKQDLIYIYAPKS